MTLRARLSRLARLAAPALLAAAALPALGGERPSFAGAESCRKCHASQFDRWAPSAHALSVRAASETSMPAEVLSGRRVEHPPQATLFSRDRGRFVATVPFDDGRAAPASVDYVVGLRRLRMFVTRLPDGRCQVLPPMREEPGGVWFDYTQLLFGPSGSAATTPAPVVLPGEPSFWTGPDRSFDARCARCHVSGYESRPAPPGERGARSVWRAPGVDCEECHGPGSQHVATWLARPAGPAPVPLQRLGVLPRERALDLCLACHLEAEPTVAPAGGSGALLERVEPTLLDDTVRVDAAGRPLELVYEGLSFLASTCATAGRLTCTDCHDAHGGAHRASLVAPTRRAAELCARCHADIAADAPKHSRHAGDASVSCLDCHMPPVTIERGHGTVHDHTIGAPRPQADGRDACSWCHRGGRGAPQSVTPLEHAELAAAFARDWPAAKERPAWRAAIEAGREGRPGAGPALRALAADAAAPAVVRASAAALLGRAGGDAAEELAFLATDRDPFVRRSALRGLSYVRTDAADAALCLAFEDVSPAIRIAAARAALAGFERVEADERLLSRVLPALEEDALAVPDDHMRWFRLGCARRIAGDDRGALEAFERKLALDPGARLVRDAVEEIRKRLGK